MGPALQNSVMDERHINQERDVILRSRRPSSAEEAAASRAVAACCACWELLGAFNSETSGVATSVFRSSVPVIASGADPCALNKNVPRRAKPSEAMMMSDSPTTSPTSAFGCSTDGAGDRMQRKTYNAHHAKARRARTSATCKRATFRTGAAPLACSFICSEMEEVETHDDEVIFDYLHATAFQVPFPPLGSAHVAFGASPGPPLRSPYRAASRALLHLVGVSPTGWSVSRQPLSLT
jgi:hypothetical protein